MTGRCSLAAALALKFSRTRKDAALEEAMLSIRQIHHVFVGEVSGVDLRQPLTREEARAIDAGMDRYAVLVFHDQNITDDQQMAFSKNFGEIENAKGGNITKDNEYRLKQGMVDVSNLDKDGKPLPRDDRRRMFNLGNRLWHSDSSFRAKPANYSILSARSVASRGGNTEFADMRAAYDTLDHGPPARHGPHPRRGRGDDGRAGPGGVAAPPTFLP